ncbi:MAG: GNAT family N-acetyltransferase, partial [Rhodospirillaceae bacterium]
SCVAVIGASNTPGTLGELFMRNLLAGGFNGPIMPVAAAGTQAVHGVLAYPDVASLPLTPDMAVICSPAEAIPAVIEALGKRGCGAAVLATAGLGSHAEVARTTARQFGMRLLGPNSLGVMVPSVGLNASAAHRPANPGRIAFVSQSGTLGTAVLDWARPKNVGFSHVVSVGDGNDLDFGDLLDYLGSDPEARAILLYLNGIHDARTFMSAARAAARNKPVLVIKGGRSAEGGANGPVTTDAVYDAAFRRAGMLRVYEIEELFAAVGTLSVLNRPKGERLAIIGNSGGVALLAADDLRDLGGRLAELRPETLERLDAVLPQNVVRGLPLDLHADADGTLYAKALGALAQSREIDAILVMHAPVAVTSASEIATKIIDTARQTRRMAVTTCFVGEDEVADAREKFHEAGMPTYETPRQAVQAFMHTVQHRRNQDILMETPASLPSEFTANTSMARQIIDAALDKGCHILNEPEAKALLAAYGIPAVETHIARTPEEARSVGADMGGTLVLKIIAPEIPHKLEHGGVRLNIEDPAELEQAARLMAERIGKRFPDVPLDGFTIQRMERRPGATELAIKVATDPVFGPVIQFGRGGAVADVLGDHAVGLPPLNMALARELAGRTRAWRLLGGYPGHEPADVEALCLTLIQVAQMVIDLPTIKGLEIDPLFADHQGVVALDARVYIGPADGRSGADRLAIRPYPQELEEDFVMKNGRTVQLRPLRPEDEPNHHVFISRLTPEDIRFRFFGLVQELPHSQMARLTQIDYDREMAFIATARCEDDPSKVETLGVVRAVTDPDNYDTEFSIVVRSDLKGSGLAKALMLKIIRYCRDRGTRTMAGQVLADNHRMLSFVESLGFRRIRVIDGDVVEIELDLQAPEPGLA